MYCWVTSKLRFPYERLRLVHILIVEVEQFLRLILGIFKDLQAIEPYYPQCSLKNEDLLTKEG